MPPNRTATGALLVIVLAFVGFLMIYIPGQIIAQYEVIREAGPVWVAVYLTVVGVGVALLLGTSGWIVGRLWWRTRQKRQDRALRNRSPSQLSRAEQQRELEANLESAKSLQEEEHVDRQVGAQLEELWRELEQKRTDQKLEIVAFGTISSGKSSLLNALAGREVFVTDPKGGTTLLRNEIPWPGHDQVILVDTPGLGEVAGADHAAVSAAAAQNADLVLVVVDGPLRDSEFQLLARLHEMEKKIIVCLNKEDWYAADQRDGLLSQLSEQLASLLPRDHVVTVRARTTQRPRVRLLPDGQQVEEIVDVPPDITQLADKMLELVRQEGHDLLLANLLLRSRGLVDESRQRVERSLDQRAKGIIERYMWAAGGAAAVSPLPFLDLAAGSAITVKMVMELARVYRQDIDLQIAVNLLGQLGKNLLGILGVSAATPAVTAAVASLLKTVPGAGTIAGGALQGVVQALITRWIGAVFMAYFKAEMQPPEGGIATLARREWQRVTSIGELKNFVKSARNHLAEIQQQE